MTRLVCALAATVPVGRTVLRRRLPFCLRLATESRAAQMSLRALLV
jgi:hypothetical protein